MKGRKPMADRIKCPACQSEISSDGKTMLSRSSHLIDLEGGEEDLEKAEAEFAKLEEKLKKANEKIKELESKVASSVPAKEEPKSGTGKPERPRFWK